jgi:rod shape-determining protein MreC
LLTFLLLGQLILLAGQVPDREGGGAEASRLEGGLLRVMAPFARGVTWSLHLIQGASDDFVLLGTLKRENAQLRLEVEALERQRLEQLDLAGEVARLREAVDYAGTMPTPVIVADILYIDHASWLQTLIAHVGDGAVEVNQAVVGRGGLVGRIVVVAGAYAKVQLLSDRAASVGGMVERTRRQGLVRGQGAGRLTLDFVPLQEDVRVGDRIVTSGIDGVYPRGIEVGTVIDVDDGGELFYRLDLMPAVEFGRLEKVYILARPPVPEKLKEATLDEVR